METNINSQETYAKRINATHTDIFSDRHTPGFESSQPVKFNGLPITNSSFSLLLTLEGSTTAARNLLPPSLWCFFAAGLSFLDKNCTLSPAHDAKQTNLDSHTHNDCVTFSKRLLQLGPKYAPIFSKIAVNI
jgi:hypothetical protein